MWSVMNSLNIVTRFTASASNHTPPPSPPRSRAGSSTNLQRDGGSSTALDFASISQKLAIKTEDEDVRYEAVEDEEDDAYIKAEGADEKTSLLPGADALGSKDAPSNHTWSLSYRITHALLRGVQVVISTITAPGRYLVACFYDDEGHFSAILPLRSLGKLLAPRRRKSSAQVVGLNPLSGSSGRTHSQRNSSNRRSASVDSNASSSTLAISDGEADGEKRDDSPARHTRSRTAAAQQQQQPNQVDDAPPRRIKIKSNTNEEDALRRRRAAKALQRRAGASPDDVAAMASSLKSPSSPSTSAARMTRYPRTPAPPRPLVPRRQPSYSLSYSPDAPKKTLIIDLDETLIHSMAKGGRMSTGHMVEVRLGGSVPTSQPGVTGPANVALGPGVPILYYVHERPGCHDFLRKVSKWYNLVVFTASVQEYADPVIDWLERERRYFGGRYYRQHCTLRNGAYIKDLAQVEPDLSRVMILDNSPMSYIFHEDNAIPIEGWISDPTDNDLLHLVPLLEGLQYVTDVRALLALRQGQAQQA